MYMCIYIYIYQSPLLVAVFLHSAGAGEGCDSSL